MSEFKEDCEWCELPLYLCACQDEDEYHLKKLIDKNDSLSMEE